MVLKTLSRTGETACAVLPADADRSGVVGFIGDAVSPPKRRDSVSTIDQRNVYTTGDLNLSEAAGFIDDIVGKWVPNADRRSSIPDNSTELAPALETVTMPPIAAADVACYTASP